jgi:hypothetical protein
MNKLIGMACAVLVLASCAKEQVTPSAGKPEVLGSPKTDYPKWDPYLEYCLGGGGECLPTVVISRAHRPAINTVLNTVATGNTANIQAAFTTYSTTLSSYVSATHITGVINGTFKATTVGAWPNIRHLLITRNSTNVLEQVYRLQ